MITTSLLAWHYCPVYAQLADPHAMFDAVLGTAASSGNTGYLLRFLHSFLSPPINQSPDSFTDDRWSVAIAAIEQSSELVSVTSINARMPRALRDNNLFLEFFHL